MLQYSWIKSEWDYYDKMVPRRLVFKSAFSPIEVTTHHSVHSPDQYQYGHCDVKNYDKHGEESTEHKQWKQMACGRFTYTRSGPRPCLIGLFYTAAFVVYWLQKMVLYKLFVQNFPFCMQFVVEKILGKPDQVKICVNF